MLKIKGNYFECSCGHKVAVNKLVCENPDCKKTYELKRFAVETKQVINNKGYKPRKKVKPVPEKKVEKAEYIGDEKKTVEKEKPKKGKGKKKTKTLEV